MQEEMKSKIDEIETRLKKIEDVVFGEQPVAKIPPAKKGYQGLAGGLRLLMDRGFFSQLRSVNEVIQELKKEKYHYSPKSIDKLLRVDFTKLQKRLIRIKDGKSWRYAIRK